MAAADHRGDGDRSLMDGAPPGAEVGGGASSVEEHRRLEAVPPPPLWETNQAIKCP